jgi:hypothetical protein
MFGQRAKKPSGGREWQSLLPPPQSASAGESKTRQPASASGIAWPRKDGRTQEPTLADERSADQKDYRSLEAGGRVSLNRALQKRRSRALTVTIGGKSRRSARAGTKLIPISVREQRADVPRSAPQASGQGVLGSHRPFL